MTLNQLRKIRRVFVILTIILLIAGTLSGVKDYQVWKQSNEKSIQLQIKQSSGGDSAVSIPSGTTKADQTDDGTIDILGTNDSDSADKGSDTDENEPPAGAANPDNGSSSVPASDPASTDDGASAGSSSSSGLGNSQTSDVPEDNDKFAFSILTLMLLGLGAIGAVAAVGTSAVIYHMNASLKEPDDANVGVRGKNQQKTAAGDFVSTTVKMETVHAAQQIPACAQFNQIGKRSRQEDCCGVLPMGSEMLAVVADGMGGLKNGGRVSELVVRTMMEQGQRRQGSSENDILLPMLHTTNETVNRALGADIYKSGSTMLAVWIQDKGKRFQWVTVGDSRIYLYRGGSLIQLNQEHNYGQELLNLAVKGQISFEEARKSPKKGELTSFIGMGQLKYVDYCVRPVDLQAGDRILLMSDGVFNSVTDQQITQVLFQNSDVQIVADQLVHLVEQFNNPKQDNFTAVILGF